MWSLIVFVIVTVPPATMIVPLTYTSFSCTASEARPSVRYRSPSIVASDSVQLSEDNFRHIAEIMLGELRTTLADKDIRLTWDDSLLGLLTEKSYSVKYGARNLRRLIEKEIENPLATAIVTGDKPLMGAHLSAVDGKVKLDTI